MVKRFICTELGGEDGWGRLCSESTKKWNIIYKTTKTTIEKMKSIVYNDNNTLRGGGRLWIRLR